MGMPRQSEYDRRTIRIALIHALKDRESYLDSLGTKNREDDLQKYRVQARADIDRMTELLNRKYGGLPKDRFQNTTLINIADMLKKI